MGLRGKVRVWLAALTLAALLYALLWAMSLNSMRSSGPIVLYITSVKTSEQRQVGASKLEEEVNSSRPLTVSSVPPAPSSLFDPEIGDLVQRLLEPPVPHSTQPLRIVLMTGLKGPFGRIPEVDRVLIDSECAVPPNACVFSENSSTGSLSSAQLLLWQNAVPSAATLSGFERPRQQLWALALYESPPHSGWGLNVFDGDRRRLDWTSGYRLDSTLPDPYERFVKRWQLERLIEEAERWPSEYRTPLVKLRINRIRDHLLTCMNF